MRVDCKIGGRQACKPGSVPLRATIISLGAQSPTRSSNLPRRDRAGYSRRSGLAPDGVCLAAGITAGAGALLPHRFTHYPPPPWALRSRRSGRRKGRAALRHEGLVCFLLHLPSSGEPESQVLPGILPSGARTFLPSRERRSSGLPSVPMLLRGNGKRYAATARWRDGEMAESTIWAKSIAAIDDSSVSPVYYRAASFRYVVAK